MRVEPALGGPDEKYIWGIVQLGRRDAVGTTTLYDILLAFAFGTLGLRRLTGSSYASNRGMNFTFRRLGFTLEGRQREAVAVRPGVYEDYLRWGLLRSEWLGAEQ